jgi:hypothetical protein
MGAVAQEEWGRPNKQRIGPVLCCGSKECVDEADGAQFSWRAPWRLPNAIPILMPLTGAGMAGSGPDRQCATYGDTAAF